MMFSIVYRPNNTIFGKQVIEEYQPMCVAARLITNDRSARSQIAFFQSIVDKSKLYQKEAFSWRDSLLVTDMDVIIPEVVKQFGFVHFLDRRHLHQSVIKYLKGEQRQNLIHLLLEFFRMMLRPSVTS